MARCELKPPAAPEPPPLPSEGGSYVLSGGQWVATQQTAPAAAEPAEPTPAPTPED